MSDLYDMRTVASFELLSPTELAGPRPDYPNDDAWRNSVAAERNKANAQDEPVARVLYCGGTAGKYFGSVDAAKLFAEKAAQMTTYTGQPYDTKPVVEVLV